MMTGFIRFFSPNQVFSTVCDPQPGSAVVEGNSQFVSGGYIGMVAGDAGICVGNEYI